MTVDRQHSDNPVPALPVLISYEDVLHELDIARSTMDNWRKEGKAPRFAKLPNGQLRTRRDWLNEWLEQLVA